MNKRKLEALKDKIKHYFQHAANGLFDITYSSGDESSSTIYASDGVVLNICYCDSYFEIYGLTKEDFNELNEYYNTLKKGANR